MFRAKRQYFMPPGSRLGFCEETQNYAKRNRSQILTCFVYRITSMIINQRFLQIVESIIIRLIIYITHCLPVDCSIGASETMRSSPRKKLRYFRLPPNLAQRKLIVLAKYGPSFQPPRSLSFTQRSFKVGENFRRCVWCFCDFFCEE